MKQHRPHGIAPTSWESGILKIRAFEMIMILFYIEDLRKFIIGSIQGSDIILGLDRLSDGKARTKEGKKMDLARGVLVSAGVINQTESDELFDLLDYRNRIGHVVQELTVDIGAYSNLSHRDPMTYEPISIYDYTAVKRAKQLRLKIRRGMTKKFEISMSMSSLMFEAAEKSYLAEIERLKMKVNKDIKKTNKLIAETNRVIKSIPESVLATAQPFHPRNTRENGALTKAGGNCIYQLYDAKATPLSVAYMMRISLKSAKFWFKKWQTSKTKLS